MRKLVLALLIGAPFAAPADAQQLWPSGASQSVYAAPSAGPASAQTFGAGAAGLARPVDASASAGQAPRAAAAPAFGAYDLARLRAPAPEAVREAGVRPPRG